MRNFQISGGFYQNETSIFTHLFKVVRYLSQNGYGSHIATGALQMIHLIIIFLSATRHHPPSTTTTRPPTNTKQRGGEGKRRKQQRRRGGDGSLRYRTTLQFPPRNCREKDERKKIISDKINNEVYTSRLFSLAYSTQLLYNLLYSFWLLFVLANHE